MRDRRRTIGLAVAMAIAIVAMAGRGAWSQEKGKAEPTKDINKSFENPDVEAYVKRFETESREVFAKRKEIVRTLGLKPGMAVADVGAGTGAFTRLVAEEVGPKGKVYAVDIAPAFLEHIAAEAKKRGHDQVTTIRGTQEATNLPANSVDVAFLVDVYHHVEKPPAVLGSIHRALRPGGHLVVVEFDRRAGVSTPFVLEHIRADKKTFLKEIESAGFERVEVKDAPEFKENFLAKFRKVDKPAGDREKGGSSRR
jgi:SAM-dependent methyltransferase